MTSCGHFWLFGGHFISLINVTNLTFAHDGSYENIFENVNFQLDTNWKLGFTGRNGRGKTTFLNLLLGKYEYRGSISTSVAFSYFPYYVMEQSILAKDVPLEVFDDRLWLAALDCVVAHSDGRLVFKFYGDIEVEG